MGTRQDKQVWGSGGLITGGGEETSAGGGGETSTGGGGEASTGGGGDASAGGGGEASAGGGGEASASAGGGGEAVQSQPVWATMMDCGRSFLSGAGTGGGKGPILGASHA